MKTKFLLRLLFPIGLVFTISACTTIPKDNGVFNLQALLNENLGDENEATQIAPDDALTKQEIEEMLSSPLSVSDAELLSMQVNPIAKASILQVGIAEADYAQAGRMENPGFSYERFSGNDNTSSLLFDIGGLFLMPLKRQVEARRLESARYEAAGSVMEHIATTRRSWINAVAEKHITGLMERTLESARAGNNMTRQMSALGHSGVIEAAESEIFLAELSASLSKQRITEGGAKEALIRQLGLWGDQARILSLPDRLPKLPASPLEIGSVEAEAIENRMDVQLAKINLEGMAKNLNLTKKSAFLSAIELGPVVENTEGIKERGYELELRIPIFDAGGVKNKKARFIFEQAQAQAEAVAITAASNARSALAVYQNSWETARHYEDVLLPLRRRVSQEQLLMYNGMLISVFDLLDDVRSATNMEADYVNAIRDFWLADTNLQQALTGSGGIPMTFALANSMSATSSGSEGH